MLVIGTVVAIMVIGYALALVIGSVSRAVARSAESALFTPSAATDLPTEQIQQLVRRVPPESIRAEMDRVNTQAQERTEEAQRLAQRAKRLGEVHEDPSLADHVAYRADAGLSLAQCRKRMDRILAQSEEAKRYAHYLAWLYTERMGGHR